ncbi:hypothetical protein GCM10027093_26400 [Paraburkholderia jirisanensis]
MKTRVTYRGYWYETAAVGSGSTTVWQGEISIGRPEEDGSNTQVLLEHMVPGEFEKMRDAIAAAKDFARSCIDRIGAGLQP